ncbi:MAG: fibronectin-binding domain-containing protein [Spirochaetes bacterium]|nr:MAG: fibronectin-binding domain-containing protein [Spirochaetota bacterium]
MSLNWKEIDLILDELDLGNSHIQKIRQPDFKTLVIDLYKPGNRFQVLISMKQGKVRLHRLTEKVSSKIPLQRFAQLLRSRINGGRIVKAYQLQGERIVTLKILRAEEETYLYLRLWGGNPNIVAVNSEGIILDAFFRRPGKGEVSGKLYKPEDQIKAASAPPGEPSGKERIFEIREWDGEESFNAFIEKYYRSRENEEEYRELSVRIRKLIESKLAQIESTIDLIEEKILRTGGFELYRVQAELLKAHLYEISPGMEEITVDNYFNSNEKFVIKLDPHISPSQNVEKLFRKYKKEKAGEENTKQELDNLISRKGVLERDIRNLFDPDLDMDSALDRLRAYAAEIKTSPEKKVKDKIPGLQFFSGDFTILVGRTATENDSLLRRYIKGNDYWLHTRDFPGGYVFIKYRRGKSIPLETLLDAGNLALFFSKGKKNGYGELYYTQAKYLRRAKNGKKGLVLPTHEKNLSITMDEKRLDKLLNRGKFDE